MKLIPLSSLKKCKNFGKYFTKVSDDDYDYLMQWNWSAFDKCGKVYAARKDKITHKTVYMTRAILKENIVGNVIDHIDGDTLNNQRENIRICTHLQNCQNRTTKSKNKTSIYKGVCYVRNENKWYTSIKINKKQVYIGRFKNEVDAAIAYDIKAKELFGDFANFNFKTSERNTN